MTLAKLWLERARKRSEPSERVRAHLCVWSPTALLTSNRATLVTMARQVSIGVLKDESDHEFRFRIARTISDWLQYQSASNVDIWSPVRKHYLDAIAGVLGLHFTEGATYELKLRQCRHLAGVTLNAIAMGEV